MMGEDAVAQMNADFDSPDAFNWAKLHPDLKPYVETLPRLGKVIRAPLVVAIDPVIPEVNRRYVVKLAAYQAEMARGNLRGALVLIERPWRIHTVLDWNMEGVMTDEQLVAEFPHTWSDAEPDDTDPGYVAIWERLSRLAKQRGYPLGDELPADAGEPLTVYRGQHNERDDRGVAWSLDPDIALRFACRMNMNEFGAILRATLPREAAYAYITDRGESEVVCNPRDLTETGWQPVTTLGCTVAADWRKPRPRAVHVANGKLARR